MKPRQMGAALHATVIFGLATSPAMATNILVNGSFDAPSATPWVEETPDPQYPIITSDGVPAQTGVKKAWLGGITSTSMKLHQDVNVPAGTMELRLRGYRQIGTTEEFGIYDHMAVQLRSPAGVLLETLAQWSNLDQTTSWTSFDLPASGGYSGQAIRLQFVATNDASFETNFFIDTVELDAVPAVDVARTPPQTLAVSRATPNPASTQTHLRLDLPSRSAVHAAIHDPSGRLVRRIADGFLDQGSHVLTWDGTDRGSGRTAPGVYLWRIDIDGRRFTRIITLLH